MARLEPIHYRADIPMVKSGGTVLSNLFQNYFQLWPLMSGANGHDDNHNSIELASGIENELTAAKWSHHFDSSIALALSLSRILSPSLSSSLRTIFGPYQIGVGGVDKGRATSSYNSWLLHQWEMFIAVMISPPWICTRKYESRWRKNVYFHPLIYGSILMNSKCI